MGVSTITSSNLKHTRSSPSHRKRLLVLRCFIALTLAFSSYWLLNYCAFPLFDTVSLWTREVSAATGGLALIAIAFVARWYPAALRRTFYSGILALLAAGSITALAGLYFSSFFPLILGASLVTVGISLASVVVGIACMSLDLKTAGICIASSYALSYALRAGFDVLPDTLNFMLFILIPFIVLALCGSLTQSLLKKILVAEPPAQTAVTAPSSFLPFVHQIFITLVIFRFIYGYTLTFGETADRTPLLPLFALLPLGIYTLILLFKKTPLNPDRLFHLSILFSIAGFLVPSIAGTQNEIIASNLLSSGTGFFEILMFFVLVALASKNHANALVVLTWGNAMASLGTIIGANFGRLANQYYHVDYAAVSTISAGIVFGLVVYILATQRNFSFADTISKIKEVPPVKQHEKLPDFDRRCSELSEKAGLTARESEIFFLLAQGRNARFIQEKLFVSYNTVKTHVSHIYAKLDVHTHQELIDLVETNQAE